MKRIISVLAVIVILTLAVSVPAFADSSTIALSKSKVTVGSNVTVTLRYNAGYKMYAIDLSLNYNSSVLQYVSGGTNNGSTVKIVEVLSGETSKSFSVTFKAIAEGSGSLQLSASASGDSKGSASAGATVTVNAVQPSSNANLGSLTLSEGALSPAFSASTTKYTASVKYPVEKITISANAAVGDSTVSGAGTFDLKVGDNSRILTVTAASGAKKTYTVTVKRMSEEETAAAEQDERDRNPYLIVINGADRLLVPDLSAMPAFYGYTLSNVERKGAQIGAFNDNAEKYQLFWSTDPNGADGAFFSRDEQDNFTRVKYIQTGDRIYIIEPFKEDINVDARFVPTEYEVNGEKISCYKYSDESLSDFYVFYCYINGKSDYYMLDTAENTVQREPTFVSQNIVVQSEAPASLIERFNQLNTQAKIILLLLLFAAVLVLVLVVLLIIKAASGKKEKPKSDDDIIPDINFNETQINYAEYENTDSDVMLPIQQPIVNFESPQDKKNPDLDEFLDSEEDF